MTDQRIGDHRTNRPLGAGSRLLRWSAWTLATVIGLILLAYGWLSIQGWADLRTEVVKANLSGDEGRGRARLEEAARRHGLDAWRRHQTQTVVAVDRWSSAGSWWPTDHQRFRAERLLGTFTSRVELLDGPRQGEVWGIQSWSAYRRPASGTGLVWVDDAAIEFYLPTLQYFDELPFRLLAAPIVLDAGPGEARGRSYDRVFVTWDRPEAHAEHDQYDVWIERDSGLIGLVRYTVRDAAAFGPLLMRPLMRTFGVGTIHFGDYRTVDGVTLPFEQTVTLQSPERAPEDLASDYFHRIDVETVSFDRVAPQDLLPDPSFPEAADAKPAPDS